MPINTQFALSEHNVNIVFAHLMISMPGLSLYAPTLPPRQPPSISMALHTEISKGIGVVEPPMFRRPTPIGQNPD
jgi:hypothetical protein